MASSTIEKKKINVGYNIQVFFFILNIIIIIFDMSKM